MCAKILGSLTVECKRQEKLMYNLDGYSMNSQERSVLEKVRLYAGNKINVVKQLASNTYVCEQRDTAPFYNDDMQYAAQDWLRSFENNMRRGSFENVKGEVSFGPTPSGGSWIIAQVTFDYKK